MRQLLYRRLAGAVAVCAVGLTLTPAFGGGNSGTICPQQVGPDVIVGDLIDVGNYTSLNGMEAFALGTTSCNIGNMNVLWQANNNNHPAIAQAMFKLKSGRFEQIGISWLKHGFTALTDNLCGCGCSGQGGSVLGVGCSDPYGSSLNGSQSGLGPRWQVNAHTGVFTYPPANPAWSGSVARRIQVHISDLEPSSATVLYFGEGQYVTKDDATWGNQNNNASYRQMSMTGSGTTWNGNWIGATKRQLPAIFGWKASDATVTLTNIQVPSDGLLVLGATATYLGKGMWHYEYALQNVNSDLSGRGFSVPVPAGAIVTNIGFHDVDYHDGDGPGNINFDGADWASARGAAALSWATTQTFAQNPSANALRWGTLYNFRFDVDRPPQDGNITLSMFKSDASVDAGSKVPGEDCNGNNIADSIDITNGTSIDANTDGVPDECQICNDLTGDNVVNVADLTMIINSWGDCPVVGDCLADIAPAGGDGFVNSADLLAIINHWGPCP